jgi:serine/threonine-protein kinase HipA
MADSLIRTAKVSFKDQIAGRLEETAAGGTRFVYRQSWQEIIACCLPIARREHEWAVGVHPYFQHLTAEGWLRERQARVAHIAEEDDFGLLLRYGADCIGAVGILPNAEEASPAALPNQTTNPGRTISGVQRKLLVVRDERADAYRPAGPTGPAPYIAKFNSQDLPTLVRNESLSLRWTAAVLGAEEVTQFRLGRVVELDEIALIVTRFDRTADGHKLRAEDFAQILSKPRGQDYAGKYDASYEDVARVVREHSARPEIDLARLFRRLIVYVLVANGDAHLKNFMLLERPEGLRLSPAYDVVNVGVYEGIDQRFALALSGDLVRLEAITRQILISYGEAVGLSRAIIDRIFRELKARARQAEKHLPHPADEGRDPFGVQFTEVVRNGCRRLLEE